MEKKEAEEMTKKGKKGEKDMDDLKKELEMTEHKITLEELAQKLGTNYTKVGIWLPFAPFHIKNERPFNEKLQFFT